MNKKKVLIIPNIPPEIVRSRWENIGRHLGDKYEVHYLTWKEPEKNDIFSKIPAYFKNSFRKRKIVKRNRMYFISLPVLHKPWTIAKYFNRFMVKKYIFDTDIDIVINAHNFLFSMPSKKTFKYFYDFVDIPFDSARKSRWDKYVKRSTHEEVKKTDGISVCSGGAAEFVKQEYETSSFIIPNGVNIEEFNKTDKSEISRLKKSLGLEGRYIIGYIGNIEHFVNIEFLISAFKKLKKEMKDAALVIIGPGEKAQKIQNSMELQDVYFLGHIPPAEIVKYFLMLDVGTLPNKLTDYEHAASYIKIFEYSAAKKMIVSAPLNSVLELNFPNIIFATHEEDSWLKAIKKARETKWNLEWDKCLNPYYLNNIASKIFTYISNINFNPSELWVDYYARKPVDKDLIVKWILKKHYWCGKYEFLRRFVKYGRIKKSDKVLEAGCGTGKIGTALAYEIGCDVTCMDYSDKALDAAEHISNVISKKNHGIKVSFVKGDLFSFNEADKYDIVFNEGVIEHWKAEEDRLKVIQNMVNAAKPGGRVIIWVPNAKNPFYKFWKFTGYSGIYDISEKPFTKEELLDSMSKAGLQNISITGHQAYITPFIWPVFLNKLRIFGIIFWFIGKIMPFGLSEKMSVKFSHEIAGIGTKPV